MDGSLSEALCSCVYTFCVRVSILRRIFLEQPANVATPEAQILANT